MAGKDPANLMQSLENLSIPELEALLQEDFIASDDSTDDVDYIMAIVEVIQRKEAAQPDYQPVDTKKAWEEFQTIYNTEEGRRYPLYPSGLPDEMKQAKTAPGRTRRRKVLRRTLLIAASLTLVIATTMVPVFGYPNVIQMVAHLANGTFRFVPDGSVSGNSGSISTIQPDGTYETLPEALEAYGIHEQVFPKVLAEDFEQVELDVREYEFTHKIEFYALYKNNSKELTVLFTQRLDLDSSDYEANDGADAQVYTVNKINHQIFDNLEQTTIIWRVGPLECFITGNLTLSESKEIIESIYEGL